MDLIESIYDYVETRNQDDLVRCLTENPEYLQSHTQTLYRGFSVPDNSLVEGDLLPKLDYLTSWTTNFDTARHFANYNRDLLKFDHVVLADLGISSEDVNECISRVIFICENPISVLGVEDHIDLAELPEEMRTEQEYISFDNTEFVITKVEPTLSDDNSNSYLIYVSQIYK